ncbi:MAG: beta-propeller fold lactonase family protein [Armatimonadetes bacterium]|nr:beta-propeller fold lactonase family protein [Armatimonadota bacterium]
MPRTANVTLNFVLARIVPANVDTFEFIGTTAGGAILFQETRAKAAQIVLEVPLNTRILIIRYFDGDRLVGIANLQLPELTPGQNFVINDPDFTPLDVPAMRGSQTSGPLGISANGTLLVAPNPENDTVSIFQIDGDNVTRRLQLAVGDDPQSAAITQNALAFVANAGSGTVSVIDLTRVIPFGRATILDTVQVGTEPSAVITSPNDTMVYVANAASNTISVINANSFDVVATVDVGAVGAFHRTLAITSDGDDQDNDEKLYTAAFFGAFRPGQTGLDEGENDDREGRVGVISTNTNTLQGTIALAPLAVSGFNSNGSLINNIPSTNPQTFTTPTAMFPNQLAGIALHPTLARAYVVSTAASPDGPFRFNTNAQGMVSVFNTATDTEVTGTVAGNIIQNAPLNLNRGIQLDVGNVPRLFLTNPVAMAWRPNGSEAWVAIQNTDVLVRLTVNGAGIPTINAPATAGASTIDRIDLEPGGKAPRGIAISPAGNRAYVFNFITRNLSLVNLDTRTVLGTVASANVPNEPAQLGAELFHTGRGPQGRMSSESWGGCIVCHPNGGLSDNVTWMFPAGPRQTISLDGMFARNDPNDQRILNFSALRDENQDFELNTRNVFGGRGLIDDDRLFLAIGGASGAGPTDSNQIEQFQQATGAVGTTNDLTGGNLPQLLGARRDFGVATLGDDRVFIVGGRSGAGQGNLVTGANTVLEFNPRTNALTQRSSTGFTARHSLGAAAVQTSQGVRIYAVGGYASTSNAALPVNTVQEYNPNTDTWRTVAALPTGVAQFGIAVAGGQNSAEPLQLLHATFGNAGSEAAPVLLGDVQRFQADAAGPGTWTNFTPAGLTPRRNHGAATAIRGVQSRIFLVGGQDGAGTVLNTVEEYQAQAATAVLTPHTNLPAPRARFGVSSSLSTNQVYVIGGIDGAGTDQTSIFEYTIANNGPVPGPAGTPSGTWVNRGNLAAPRHGLGLSIPPGVANYHPVPNAGRDPRQDAINVWIQERVRALNGPVNDADAAAGRALFGQVGAAPGGFSCADCHGGPKWTRSRRDFNPPPSSTTGIGFGNEQIVGAELRVTASQPGNNQGVGGLGVLLDVGTFLGTRLNEIRFNPADISQRIAALGANGFNIPSLLSLHTTAPYFHNGMAETLDQALNGTFDGQGASAINRVHTVANPANRANLIQFLRSIDDTTPIFP